MLSTTVYNFFPFKGNLAEKRPYKHRGKIMKYTTFFNWLVLQFYQSTIMPGFCRSDHILNVPLMLGFCALSCYDEVSTYLLINSYFIM